MWAIDIQNTNLELQIHSSYFATRWKFWLETWSNLSLDRRLILLSAFEKMFFKLRLKNVYSYLIVWRCFWTMDKNTLSYLAISKVALKYLISCWSWMSKVQIMILNWWFAHLHSNQYECVCISKSGPCNVQLCMQMHSWWGNSLQSRRLPAAISVCRQSQQKYTSLIRGHI